MALLITAAIKEEESW